MAIFCGLSIKANILFRLRSVKLYRTYTPHFQQVMQITVLISETTSFCLLKNFELCVCPL